jgi:hypothetical protein
MFFSQPRTASLADEGFFVKHNRSLALINQRDKIIFCYTVKGAAVEVVAADVLDYSQGDSLSS